MLTATQEVRAWRSIAEELRLLEVKDAAVDDPKYLINEIRYFDPTTEAWVEFKMFPPKGWEPIDLAVGPATDWFWQAQIIDWWQDPKIKRYLILKARQLGITLLACARALWLLLFRPGTATIAFSYEEGEAKKLVEATWQMFNSLPELLRSHVEILSPYRGDIPSEWIKLRHSDGRISTFQSLPATRKHGHGGRVSWVIMDEAARQDYFREVYEAVNPSIGRGNTAKLAIISTANGVSNEQTGDGNYFHRLYATKREKGLAFQFLPWNLEPTRDELWYQHNAMVLDDVERNRQYPLSEHDAFMLSGALFFDSDSLQFYKHDGKKKPVFVGDWVRGAGRQGQLNWNPQGSVEIYEKPRGNGSYAIGVDTATGRAKDSSSADVIDLSSGAIVACLHTKDEAPRVAQALHYLGKMYNTARIAIERQGGYGEALIYFMRDGTENMPAYQNLYRHSRFTTAGHPISEQYGIPMGANRHGLLDGLKEMIRDRTFPWMPTGHMAELTTFIYRPTNPSPAAQDGCNDDRVMSLCIAAEMYRQFGKRPEKRTAFKKKPYRPHPVRQTT